MKLGIQSSRLHNTQSNEDVADRVREFGLGEVDCDGTAVLEHDSTLEDPIPALTRRVEKIKAEMSLWSWS
ncbi:MAG: hypothetical protein AAFY08_02585 [Planctomycetota bacterium]